MGLSASFFFAQSAKCPTLTGIRRAQRVKADERSIGPPRSTGPFGHDGRGMCLDKHPLQGQVIILPNPTVDRIEVGGPPS